MWRTSWYMHLMNFYPLLTRILKDLGAGSAWGSRASSSNLLLRPPCTNLKKIWSMIVSRNMSMDADDDSDGADEYDDAVEASSLVDLRAGGINGPVKSYPGAFLWTPVREAPSPRLLKFNAINIVTYKTCDELCHLRRISSSYYALSIELLVWLGVYSGKHHT